MGNQQATLKLLPSTKMARDKALFSKYMGTHHCASSSPFWFERLKEVKSKIKTSEHCLKISDYYSRRLITFTHLFTKKYNGLAYTMCHPLDSVNNFVLQYLPQYRFNIQKHALLTALSGINPHLGLSIEQLFKMELLGGSVTEYWAKWLIIYQNGGLNPDYGYGRYAFGHGQSGQINRLAAQELTGKAPHMEAKLMQDCESLGLTSILDEHHDEYKCTPSIMPRLTPSYSYA